MKNLLTQFKALADETRLRIMRVLMAHELNVKELVAVLDMGQSRVSRHVRILVDAGLLVLRRDGLWSFYSADKSGPGKDLLEALAKPGDETFAADAARAEGLIHEKARATRIFFDRVAPDLEQMNKEVLGDFDLAGEVVAKLPQCDVSADLGCGSGVLIPKLLARSSKVIGVDGSPEMLKRSEAHLDGDLHAVSLRIGQIEHLPLRDGEAGCAIINLVLHHLSQPAKGLEEAWRILAPGGVLMVVDFDKHDNETMRSRFGDHWLGFAGDQLNEWLEQAGFQVMEARRKPVNMGLGLHIIKARKPQT